MLFPRVVYAIKNDSTGKIYVGSSHNFEVRKNAHINDLKRGQHVVEDFQKDYDTFGETFSFYILDEIKDITEKEKEYEWMLKLRTNERDFGYNYNDKKFNHDNPWAKRTKGK